MRAPLPTPGAIRDKCAAARHPQHELRRHIYHSGGYALVLICVRCDRNVTPELKGKNALSKIEAQAMMACDASFDDLPTWEPFTRVRSCYVCGSFARCEDDHVAERAIHGAMAELLPIVPLCPKCHDQKSKNLQDFIRKHRGAA